MSECVCTLVSVHGAYACVNVLVSVRVRIRVCLLMQACVYNCICVCMCSCVRACVRACVRGECAYMRVSASDSQYTRKYTD